MLDTKKRSGGLCGCGAAHCTAWRVTAALRAASPQLTGNQQELRTPEHFVSVFTQANINGRVLAQCSVDELKKEMNMNFGDWHLFRSMVRFYSSYHTRHFYYTM